MDCKILITFTIILYSFSCSGDEIINDGTSKDILSDDKTVSYSAVVVNKKCYNCQIIVTNTSPEYEEESHHEFYCDINPRAPYYSEITGCKANCHFMVSIAACGRDEEAATSTTRSDILNTFACLRPDAKIEFRYFCRPYGRGDSDNAESDDLESGETKENV